jgi:hypothetical protein
MSKPELTPLARQAVALENEACARLADECVNIETLADSIRQRLSKRVH